MVTEKANFIYRKFQVSGGGHNNVTVLKVLNNSVLRRSIIAFAQYMHACVTSSSGNALITCATRVIKKDPN